MPRQVHGNGMVIQGKGRHDVAPECSDAAVPWTSKIAGPLPASAIRHFKAACMNVALFGHYAGSSIWRAALMPKLLSSPMKPDGDIGSTGARHRQITCAHLVSQQTRRRVRLGDTQ